MSPAADCLLKKEATLPLVAVFCCFSPPFVKKWINYSAHIHISVLASIITFLFSGFLDSGLAPLGLATAVKF